MTEIHNERGAGRKTHYGVKKTARINANLTPEHREKYLELGGTPWLEKAIDRDYEALEGN